MKVPYFLVELFGDLTSQDSLPKESCFQTLEEAFAFIEKEVCVVLTEENPEDPDHPRTWYHRPDPEDDRILIWQVEISDQKKIVWHFSGWHWPYDRGDALYDVEQGKLPGHERSLYEEVDD